MTETRNSREGITKRTFIHDHDLRSYEHNLCNYVYTRSLKKSGLQRGLNPVEVLTSSGFYIRNNVYMKYFIYNFTGLSLMRTCSRNLHSCIRSLVGIVSIIF